MKLLYLSCAVLYMISYYTNKAKTYKSLKMSKKMFTNILPTFLFMILLMSIILYAIPPSFIAERLSGENLVLSVMLASILGSIALVPGFIAFPVAGMLLKEGVSYVVLAAFTTTLMMVGVTTYPLESKYFGMKLAIIRNLIAFITAIAVSVVIGILLK